MTPLVSLQTNQISYGGRDYRLTPTQAEIASVLAESFNTLIPSERLARAVFGKHATKRDRKTLMVHIHFLRARLADLGLAVEVRQGQGYAMKAKRAEAA